MSDEDALLNAIAAHPEEDTPRLMYADWLDENGQPLRAEFIRVQIDVSRIEQLPRIELNPYVNLFKRNQELIENHRTELLGSLRRLPADAGIEFHRGFAWEVTLSAFHFNQRRDTLAAARPRPRVTVEGSVGVITGFLGLNVPHSEGDPQSELVTAIRTAPDEGDTRDLADEYYGLNPLSWPRLEELDLSGCLLGDQGVNVLLTWSTYPALISLDLSGNLLSDLVVDTLLTSTLPLHLKRLVLGGNDITEVGAMALAERWPTGEDDRLENLNLRFTQIGQAGQAALLRRFGGRVELF